MVSKSRVLLFAVCLVSLISQGLARTSSAISPRPSKALVECYDAMFDLGFCNGEIIMAAQSGRIGFGIGPSCCKAASKITSGCWSMLFPFNRLFSRVLQLSCARLSLTPPPPSTNTPLSNSKGPVAPTPDALPMSAPSPAVEGPFMDTPMVAPSPAVRGRL
ncbi:prolamin-like domain-containing protein [Artemisia annua]|uniref:Prolamin-like domain-containing protein n=1 Tax=Artemisia annua TaxID=35608 RepID=A0A2U1Q2J0_ARTAN|nr:prolamin-like domain-containing protein [Artemisia annua]